MMQSEAGFGPKNSNLQWWESNYVYSTMGFLWIGNGICRQL